MKDTNVYKGTNYEFLNANLNGVNEELELGDPVQLPMQVPQPHHSSLPFRNW